MALPLPPEHDTDVAIPLTDGGAEAGGTLLGLRFEEGALLAADTRKSNGSVVGSDEVQKITQVHPTAAMGSAGDLGGVQAFLRAIRAEVDRFEHRSGEPIDLSALGTFAAGKLRSQSAPDATFVLGGVDEDGSHVLTVGSEEGALEVEYAAVGSGREIAIGILDDELTGSTGVAAARRIAARAIEGAAARDAATGVGFHLAEITGDGVVIERHEPFDDLP